MFSFPTNPLRDGLIEVSTVADRRFSRYLIECSSQQNKRKKKSRFNRLRTLTVIIIHVRVLNDYVRTCSYENNKLGYGINQKKKRRLVSVPQKCAKYMGTIRQPTGNSFLRWTRGNWRTKLGRYFDLFDQQST